MEKTATEIIRRVALVSPVDMCILYDMHKRAANTSGRAEDFIRYEWQKQYRGSTNFIKVSVRDGIKNRAEKCRS